MKGWEPREFTTYQYDGGRLVGSVTRREPEFTRAEVALMLAHERYEADLGPDGFPMSEATDPENWRAFVGNEKPRVDWAAKAREDARDAYYKKYPEANRNGHLWSVRKR